MNSYANALLELATQKDEVNEISYQFDSLNETIRKNRKWLKIFDSPMLSKEQKFGYIDELSLNPLLADMLKLLAEKNHMYQFDDVYPEWVRMLRERNHVIHLNVYTAKVLSKSLQDELREQLQPFYKDQTIEIHVKVRPELIGGMKIVYQGEALDRSIFHELEELFMNL